MTTVRVAGLGGGVASDIRDDIVYPMRDALTADMGRLVALARSADSIVGFAGIYNPGVPPSDPSGPEPQTEGRTAFVRSGSLIVGFGSPVPGMVAVDRTPDRSGLTVGYGPAARSAARALRDGGVAALADAEILFALVSYDAASGELVLATDRFGNFPVYYRQDGGRLTFGTDVAAVLRLVGGPFKLDRQSLGETLWFGHPIGDRTLTEGVLTVPPAAAVSFRDGGSETRCYWRLRFAPVPADERVVALAAAEREFGRAVDAALTGEGIALAVTGGIDSRAILAEYIRSGVQATLFTAGEEGAADLAAGQMLSRQVRSRHHAELLGDGFADGFPEAAADLVRFTGAALGLENSHLAWLDQTCGRRFRALIDGGGAEICKRALLRRRGGRCRGPVAIRELLMTGYGHPDLARTLLPLDEHAALGESVGQLIDQRLAEVAHDRAGDALDAFFARVIWPTFHAPGVALQARFLEGRVPFLARGFVDAMARVPLAVRDRGGIQRYVVDRNAPALRNYGQVIGGYRIPWSQDNILKYLLPAGLSVLDRLGSGRIERVAFPYEKWLRGGCGQVVDRWAEALLERGVVDRQRASSALSSPLTKSRARLVLARLELWHRILPEGSDAVFRSIRR